MWCAGKHVGWTGVVLAAGLCCRAPRIDAQASRPPSPPQFVEGSCPTAPGGAGAVNLTVRCGSVTVPQERGAGDRRLAPVVLPVIVYRATGARGTPVLFLAGGPGQSSIEVVQQVLLTTPVGQLLLHEHPIIAFDRRGITPSRVGASPDLGSIGFAPAGRRAQALAALTDSLSRRARRLRGAGVEPAAFTTAAAVRDMADVLRALRVDRVVLFGASYGTHEALRFMRLYPEMVEAAVLDGVAPPSATQLLDSGFVAAAGRGIAARIIEECRVDVDCGPHYSELSRAVARLTDSSATRLRRTARFRLTAEGRVSESWHTLEVAGASVLTVLGVASTIDEIRASLPRIIEEFATADTLRDPNAPDILLAAVIDPSLQTSARQQIPLVRLVALCGDRPQGEPIAAGRALCDALGVPFGGADLIAPVSSDLPTLLISSGYDAQTPAAVADEAAKTLSNARRVHFPTAGHVAFPRPIAEVCVALVVDGFLRFPHEAPRAGCAAGLTPAFASRAPSTAVSVRER